MISHSEIPTPSFPRGPDGIHRLATGEEGLTVMELLDALYSSAARGEPVKISR